MARGRGRPRKQHTNGAATAAPQQSAGNVSKPAFLEAYDNIVEKLRKKKEADSALSNAYKAAERAGIDKKDLKRAIADKDLTTDERELRTRRYVEYMNFLGVDVGHQFTMDMDTGPSNENTDPAETAAEEKHEANEAFEQGVSAGRAGASTNSNPYQPGTEQFASFSTGWAEGQRLAVESLGGATA